MDDRVLVVLVIAAVAACSGRSDECRTDARALRTLLAETPHEPTALVADPNVELVSRSDLPVAPVPHGPVLSINADSIVFQGQKLDPASVEETLRAVRAQAAEAAGSSSGPRIDLQRLYLRIDRSTPWSQIVALVDDAHSAGFTAPAFAFETPAKLTPPPRSPVDDRLDRLQRGDGAETATELAMIIKDIVKTCPPLERAFGAAAGVSSGSKADAIIAAIEPALIECGCSVDLPALRSVMWRLLAVEPTIQVIAFDATTRSEMLLLPGATTWAEASKRLAAGTRGVRFVVE